MITQIKSDSFPIVQVQAILRDRRGKPIPTGNMGGLTVLEKVFDQEDAVSNDSHQFTVNTISTSAEVLFVIDVAGDLTKPGASRESYRAEMLAVLQAFLQSMQPADKAGILVVTGSQVNYLQPLTTDQDLLTRSIEIIPTGAENISFGRYGLDRALYELSILPDREIHAQGIILMTPQLFHGEAGLENILAKAIEERIPISCVLTRDIEYKEAAEPLQSLAIQTGGVYAFFRNAASAQPIFDALNEQRIQTLLSFRSRIGDSSERTIELTLKDITGTFKATKTYQVALQPPEIKILSPQANQEILRQAASNQANLALVEPTSLPVTATINWIDGYPRQIASAQLLIDGNPATASYSDNAQGISFEWDIRSYQEPGTQPFRLSIQVQDELGLTGLSQDTTVNLRVSIPDLAPQPTQTSLPTPEPQVTQIPVPSEHAAACGDLAGFQATLCQATSLAKALVSTPSGWFTIAGLLLAIFAILMAFRYRGPINRAGSKALVAMQETVTILRRPAPKDADAYLQVLQGDDELAGKSLPISANHVTIIGRSLRDAELAFQSNQERSVVSRKHCEIHGEKGRFRIIDLGSTHGTYVNGQRLSVGGSGKILSNADQIELGPAQQGGVLLEFTTSRSKAETKIESADSRPTYFGNL